MFLLCPPHQGLCAMNGIAAETLDSDANQHIVNFHFSNVDV